MSADGIEFDPNRREPSGNTGQERTDETSSTRLINETFNRIQIRMEDLLSTVEDSLKSTQDGVDEQVDGIIENLSSKLKAAGLGVFTTRAVSIAKDELESGLSSEAVLAPVFDTISEVREEVRDIVTKSSRGTVRTIGQSTASLQSSLVRLYARLNEREQDLEAALVNIRQLRSRVTELETVISSKDKSLNESQEEIAQLKQVVSNLEATLESRDADLSALKGELQQAKSQIDEQRRLIEKLDSAEELVSDYEEKTQEISELKGKLAAANETISQRNSTIEQLRDEVSQLSGSAVHMEARIDELDEKLAVLSGERDSSEAEAERLAIQIAELEARWDMLYQVAEDEPGFKAYFVVADKKHWFQLSHLSSALGVPVVLLKRQLQKFIDVGLLEIDDERIRPRNLSQVAQEAAGAEEKVLEDAKVELEKTMEQSRVDEDIPPAERPEIDDNDS